MKVEGHRVFHLVSDGDSHRGVSAQFFFRSYKDSFAHVKIVSGGTEA